MKLRPRIFFIMTVPLSIILLSYFFIDMEKTELELRMPFDSEVIATAPWDAPGQNWGRIRRQVFESVFKVGIDGQLEPGITEDWKASKDFKTFDFTIKSGIRFSNGQTMVVDDVIASIKNNLSGKDSFSPSFKKINEIRSVTKIGPLKFRINLSKASPDFLMFLAMPEFEIYPASIIEADFSRDPFKYWVGTGPYMLADTFNDKIILKPNPYYSSHSVFNKISFNPSIK